MNSLNRFDFFYLLMVFSAGCTFIAGCTPQPSDQESVEATVRSDTIDPKRFTERGDSSSFDSRFTYECESGETVKAWYNQQGEALVQYKERTYRMEVVISASGARYAGNDLEWWTKGTGPGAEGTLYTHHDGETGEIIEECRQK